MWGDSRMAVLSEDEAQKWILGVSNVYTHLSLILRFGLSPPTIPPAYHPFLYLTGPEALQVSC